MMYQQSMMGIDIADMIRNNRQGWRKELINLSNTSDRDTSFVLTHKDDNEGEDEDEGNHSDEGDRDNHHRQKSQ